MLIFISMYSNFKANKIHIIICSVIAVLFIITAVIFGAYKIVAIRYDEMLALELPDWQGVINIWHIDTFRTPGSSKASALSNIAKLFEKKYRGIFIEIEEITPEEYKKRVSEGKSADVVTFPADMNMDLSACSQLITPYGLMPIHETCLNFCDNRAVPWLWTMPMAVVNQDFVMKHSIEVESNPTLDEFEEIINLISESSGKSVAANEFALTNLIFADMNLPVGSPMTCWQAWQAFSQKESYVVFGGLWEIAAMQRLNERNKGFATSVMQIPDELPGFCWTQWICIVSSDENCIEYSRKFIDMMLTPGNQQKIAESTGCLSVLSGQTDYQGYQKETYFREGELVAIVPGGSFDSGTVLQALEGDGLARAALLNRLAVMDNTNTMMVTDAGEP